MGYKKWNPKSGKLVRSHDVIFHEDIMHKNAILVKETQGSVHAQNPVSIMGNAPQEVGHQE
eukprot:c51899_g1_i1 orf=1-183(+)